MKYYQEFYGNIDQERTKKRYEQLTEDFCKQFKRTPQKYFTSSGRCELLGNHTDHNNGKVLVASINYDIIACAAKTNNDIITVKSDFGIDKININSHEIRKEEKSTTTALIRGVVDYCANNGVKLGGFECTTNSVVPSGSGLSSSACFEVLICQIISTLYNNDEISPIEKVFCSHHAETIYFGKPCGLLDQCGVAFGGICYIDFEHSDNPYVKCCKVNVDKQMVLIKTKEDHASLTSHYAAIKNEMCQVAECFSATTLRQVNPDIFEELYNATVHNRPLDRAKHFFDENIRVEKGYLALLSGDLPTFYAQINASGNSSRYLLKNCQIDDEPNSPICYILDELKKIDPLGAYRVHGGGFRGSVLAFIDNSIPLSLLQERFGTDNVIPISFRQLGACSVDYNQLFEE